MNRRRFLVLAALVVAVSSLFACKQVSNSTTGEPATEDTVEVNPVSTLQQTVISDTATVTVLQVPSRIVIDPKNVTIDALGDTIQFRAFAYDAKGNEIPGLPIRFRSTNPEVLTVDPNTGVAVSVGNGTAQVIAEYLLDSSTNSASSGQ